MQHFAMQSSWTFTLDFPLKKKKITEEQVATKKTRLIPAAKPEMQSSYTTKIGQHNLLLF